MGAEIRLRTWVNRDEDYSKPPTFTSLPILPSSEYVVATMFHNGHGVCQVVFVFLSSDHYTKRVRW